MKYLVWILLLFPCPLFAGDYSSSSTLHPSAIYEGWMEQLLFIKNPAYSETPPPLYFIANPSVSVDLNTHTNTPENTTPNEPVFIAETAHPDFFSLTEQLKMFFAGAFVFLCGLLFGILITRISLKRARRW